jgi:hypothetical protein
MAFTHPALPPQNVQQTFVLQMKKSFRVHPRASAFRTIHFLAFSIYQPFAFLFIILAHIFSAYSISINLAAVMKPV